jgi:1,4-dihydroxy-2-naphthoyl-CoA hydrolase
VSNNQPAKQPTSRADIQMDKLSSAELTDALNAYGLGELAEAMGIKLQEVSADKTIGTMPVMGNRQPLGLLNGGASAVLAETLGSIAANVHAYPERVAVGTDLQISHHRPAVDGEVTATATALHLGKSLGTYLIEIRDKNQKLTASAKLSVFFKEKNNG